MKDTLKRTRASDVHPSPFKTTRPSPLRSLLFLRDNPKYILIDPAHTFAIDGIGKSYLASAIILLMHMGVWGRAGATKQKLQRGYERFIGFCKVHKKSTTIHEFSYKTLKLPEGSYLVWSFNFFSFTTSPEYVYIYIYIFYVYVIYIYMLHIYVIYIYACYIYIYMYHSSKPWVQSMIVWHPIQGFEVSLKGWGKDMMLPWCRRGLMKNCRAFFRPQLILGRICWSAHVWKIS